MFDKLKDITGGDAERMKVHFTFYIECISENIELLREALDSGNIQDTRAVVHTSKPIFDSFEFTEMWQLANDIEQHIDGKVEIRDYNEKIVLLSKYMLESLEKVKSASYQ